MREMKDSGIEWIGMIPADWNIVRIGNQYTERKTKVSDRDYPPLSITMKGILPQLASAAKTDAHDDRKLVCKGDFAINSRSDRRGSCGISAYDGSVSLINTILQPRDEMNPEYYDWLFHSSMFSDEFYKWGHGIVDDLWTTNWQDMKRIAIPEPPLDEQQRIADYLSGLCAEIDAVIAKTRATIEEYKKLKQSVITEAVTKGIRSNRPMKEPGIEWIGEIPAEWDVSRTKMLFDFGKGLPITKENLVEKGVSVISYGQIHSKTNSGTTLNDDLFRFVSEDYLNTDANSLVQKNDFIVADTSEDLDGCGNCVFVDSDMILFAGYHTIILHSNSEDDNKYLAYLFKTDCWRSQIRSKVSGVKLFSISKKILADTTLLLPSIEEREEIVEYLDKQCKEIDNIIARKTALLAEMESYKKSVIYEYVTGKKEVTV